MHLWADQSLETTASLSRMLPAPCLNRAYRSGALVALTSHSEVATAGLRRPGSQLPKPPEERLLGPVNPRGGTLSLRCIPCFIFHRSQHRVWKYIHLATEPPRSIRLHPYQRMRPV
jgi:hypothetical protein